MSRRDRRQPSASFLKDRTGVALARLCVENGAEKLFAQFIASIPYADDSVNYSSNINDKPKEKFKIKDGRTSREDRLKNDEDTNKNKNNTSNRVNSTRKRQESSNSKQEAKNTSNSKREQCIFCKKERVRINDHYLTKHKIDFPLWVKKVTENQKHYNDTTCRQCEVDYKDDCNFEKHIMEYHNVNLRMHVRKRAKVQKSKYIDGIFDKIPTVKNKRLIQGSREFKSKQSTRETAEKEPNSRKREIVEPTTQNEKRKARQDEIEVEVPKITRFCVLCGEYVEVFSFKEHVADHRRGKKGFLFKTTTKSSQETATEQTEIVRYSNNNNQIRMNYTTNYSSSIGGEAELAATQNAPYSSVENTNPVPPNSEEDRITETGDGVEEADARVMCNEERTPLGIETSIPKSGFKELWKGYYQRMLLEKDEGRRKMMYKKFLHLKKTMNSTLSNKNKGTLSISTW